MFPEPLFQILDMPVTVRTLLYPAGLLAGLALFQWTGRKRKLPVRLIVDAYFISMIGAYLGARLLALMENQGFFTPADALETAIPAGTGVSSLGGITGALVCALAFYSINRETRHAPLQYMDAFVPALLLFQVFWRVGCLSAGCCHGIAAPGLRWAISFTDPAAAAIYRGVPLHPTQAYMILGNLLLLVTLLWILSKSSFRGQLTGIYLISYGLLRFVVGYYRGDIRPMLGSWSLAQWTGLLFILVGTGLLIKYRSAPARRGNGRIEPC